MMVLYNAYRIVRQDAGGSRVRGARYYVQRPDGSECSRDCTWAEAERAVRRDLRASRWPEDSLPPNFAAQFNNEPNTPSPPTPGAT